MADLAELVVPLEGVNFLLNAIGFNQAAQRELIMAAGLADYEDFRYLVDKDIRDMAEEFGKRTQPNGRIIFGPRSHQEAYRCHALDSRLSSHQWSPRP